MDMPPEVLEQLLDPGPKCSPFRFLCVCVCVFFFTDPVLRTFLYRCRMAHDDGGLCCNDFLKVRIRESEDDGDRINDSIDYFTHL